MGKRVEQQIADLVEAARPTPQMPPERRAQAMSAMTQAGRRHRPWRRLAVLAAACVAVALGVLLVPRPNRTAGDFGQAFAAMERAKTLHISGWVRRDDGEYRFEQWYGNDGFFRCDLTGEG